MQFCCNNTSIRSAYQGRRALTLLELIMVMAILIVLSGMVIPLIEGLGRQTNASSNATVVNDVNAAIGTFSMQHELNQFPDGWDSLLNTTGTLFSRLHINVSGTTGGTSIPPLVVTSALTQTQLDSLAKVGIRTIYDAQENGSATSPNSFSTSLNSGRLAVLTTTAKSRPFSDSQFSLKQLNSSVTTTGNEFVVLGLCGMNSLRGTTVRDVPLISSADPNNNYARMLCVFMIPGDGSAAKYVGCFLPDGSSLRMNVDDYHNTRKDL